MIRQSKGEVTEEGKVGLCFPLMMIEGWICCAIPMNLRNFDPLFVQFFPLQFNLISNERDYVDQNPLTQSIVDCG